MTHRSRQIASFLKNAGWGSATHFPLAADASFRRYIRLELGERRAMLMDAPPPKEDVRPFVLIAEHLSNLGLNAPEIFARDIELGFLLLEDFGDETFTKLLASGQNEEQLYFSALDTLVFLHQHPAGAKVKIPDYDFRPLFEEANLFVDWYWPEIAGNNCPVEIKKSYMDAWRQTILSLPPIKQVLVLRDYHVDNVMLLEGRSASGNCGLLDFQDALLGPCAYDVMSLCEDARRDVSADLKEALIERYLSAMPMIDQVSFKSWLAVLAVHRHAKVAGIFMRLLRRDGKDIYLKHIPRVIGLLASHLDKPELAPIQNWVTTYFPDYQNLPEFIKSAA